MGTRDIAAGLGGLPPQARQMVAAYLSRLDGALPLPRAERARVLTEAADALVCEIEARVAEGESAAEAAGVAVAGFGDPTELAGQYATALLPVVARRTGALLVLSGPVVGLTWVSAMGIGSGLPARIGSLLTGVPLLPLLLALTVPAALIAVIAGRRNRLRRNLFEGWAGTAASLATVGCVAADGLLLVTATGSLISGGAAATGWVVCALALSVLRLAGAVTAGQRLTRLRAAVC